MRLRVSLLNRILNRAEFNLDLNQKKTFFWKCGTQSLVAIGQREGSFQPFPQPRLPLHAQIPETCYNSSIVPETLDELESIAVFPLATVLFPGAILPLHIFEPRYLEMIRYAIDNGGVFGLSYRSDAAIARETPPETGSVGCIAHINAVVPLDDGRMNLISTGVVRYRVAGLLQSTPFIVARIEHLTDDLEPGEDLNRSFDDIFEVCRKFLVAAQALDEPNAPSSQELPEDPEAFSLLVASALPIDNDAKQTLLEITSTRLRLSRLRPHAIAALADYRDRIEVQRMAKGNGHGRMRGDETR